MQSISRLNLSCAVILLEQQAPHLWTQYKNGVRNYCGNALPEGLRKNQKLAKPVLTPTTKEKKHDRPISPAEIIAEGLMTQADWDEASYMLPLQSLSIWC